MVRVKKAIFLRSSVNLICLEGGWSLVAARLCSKQHICASNAK